MGKYIVTGGAGFVGSFLTDALIEQGHEVIVIDDFSQGSYQHPQAKTVKANILDEEQIRPLFEGLDGCYHLVGIPSVVMTMQNWFHFNAINLHTSLIIFKLAIEHGLIPVVYASSCVVYGETEELPLKEDQYIKPVAVYGSDKLAVESNAFALAHNYELPNIGLRFFNVFGPRQNPESPYSGVITKFINRLKENKSPIIFGDGNQTRDFIFVKDVVRNVIKAMDLVSTDAEVVNLCTGKGITVNHLAEELSQLMHKKVNPIYQEKRSYDIMHSVGSTEKMQEFGFDLKYDLAAGLKETVDHFLS